MVANSVKVVLCALAQGTNGQNKAVARFQWSQVFIHDSIRGATVRVLRQSGVRGIVDPCFFVTSRISCYTDETDGQRFVLVNERVTPAEKPPFYNLSTDREFQRYKWRDVKVKQKFERWMKKEGGKDEKGKWGWKIVRHGRASANHPDEWNALKVQSCEFCLVLTNIPRWAWVYRVLRK